jgi:hypothetical protein
MDTVVQGWFIETTKGESFQLFIKSGYYATLEVALDFCHRWFAMRSTGFVGTEKDIVNSITDKNRVNIIREDGRAFKVVDLEDNVLFSSNEVRAIFNKIYKI